MIDRKIGIKNNFRYQQVSDQGKGFSGTQSRKEKENDKSKEFEEEICEIKEEERKRRVLCE